MKVEPLSCNPHMVSVPMHCSSELFSMLDLKLPTRLQSEWVAGIKLHCEESSGKRWTSGLSQSAALHQVEKAKHKRDKSAQLLFLCVDIFSSTWQSSWCVCMCVAALGAVVGWSTRKHTGIWSLSLSNCCNTEKRICLLCNPFCCFIFLSYFLLMFFFFC